MDDQPLHDLLNVALAGPIGTTPTPVSKMHQPLLRKT